MTEIISYEKDDISKEVKKMQFDARINLEVIDDLEAMERTPEVEEALAEAYAEKEELDFLCIQLLLSGKLKVGTSVTLKVG